MPVTEAAESKVITQSRDLDLQPADLLQVASCNPKDLAPALEVGQHRQDARHHGYAHALPPLHDGLRACASRISSMRGCHISSAMAAWRKASRRIPVSVLPCTGHAGNRERMSHDGFHTRRESVGVYAALGVQ